MLLVARLDQAIKYNCIYKTEEEPLFLVPFYWNRILIITRFFCRERYRSPIFSSELWPDSNLLRFHGIIRKYVIKIASLVLRYPFKTEIPRSTSAVDRFSATIMLLPRPTVSQGKYANGNANWRFVLVRNSCDKMKIYSLQKTTSANQSCSWYNRFVKTRLRTQYSENHHTREV